MGGQLTCPRFQSKKGAGPGDFTICCTRAFSRAGGESLQRGRGREEGPALLLLRLAAMQLFSCQACPEPVLTKCTISHFTDVDF